MTAKHTKRKYRKDGSGPDVKKTGIRNGENEEDGALISSVDAQTEDDEGKRKKKGMSEKESEKDIDSDKGADKLCEEKKRSHKRHKSKRKRQLDEVNEQPNEFIKFDADPSEAVSFTSFNLDERLLKAIGELGWETPTQIQQSMIPLALEDKNITARARTGSGKTAAFMLPVIQKVLHLVDASSSNAVSGPYALFIAPTRELAAQIFRLLVQLTAAFPFLQSMNFSELDPSNQDDWLKEEPDMLVSTPSRLVNALKRKPQLCAQLRHVVLDEADLLLSYGYEEDMRQLKEYLPQNYQTIFTSATLSEDIGPLKKMFLHGPLITLKLKEGQLPSSEQLAQYLITCRNEEERFAILLAMVKLRLLVGKSIIFVSGPDRCYQLGLFLQAFQIRSCILNAQMPANSRCHVVDEFNEGRYNYVIASDINDILADDTAEEEHQPRNDEEPSMKKQRREKRKRKAFDRESGVARGIDFHHVSNVVNFDFPTTFDCYVHRVGRTARGWNKGTALSFATPGEESLVEQVRHEITAMGLTIFPYEIRIKELESFVLRAREALAACTRSVIREARLAEIKGELLRSKRLDGYFAKNPRERAALEHDKKLHTLSLHSPAIADVPDYMVPPSLRGLNFAPQNAIRRKGRSQRRHQKRMTAAQAKHKRRMDDPLQSFSV
ncbi:putative ATP-dependent RNA helicase DDX56 [Toxocara canis]|uniref:RNA helicase n=1 Tax=Toxocara canis TaxID=6265 RepID=A0A0B2VNX7_TOXCA|nr:putative ATP-dependent RNA helicase DDX56 [Toxocara canis]